MQHTLMAMPCDDSRGRAHFLWNNHLNLCPTDALQDCTGQMDDSGFIVYSNFVQHVESMCLFILNQDFDRHTEHLINTLHGATQSAKDNLAAVASELSEQVRLSDKGLFQTGESQHRNLSTAQGPTSLAVIFYMHPKAPSCSMHCRHHHHHHHR